ncbi:MAG: ATP-binding protein [Oscillospiraceae bacterium]|nr:ATP-binding protein [Oscillospiraceae bacterium]
MLNLIDRYEYLENLKKFRDVDLIKVVTGVRRCGKSTLFDLYIEYLKSTGVEDNQIVAINLEEKENEHLLDEKALYDFLISQILKEKTTYFFIDEVQMCENFEKAIDSLYVKKNTDVYITGSNADMLSRELATLLTGRYVEIKMLPLSFKEFKTAFPNLEKSELFNRYLNYGAFPILTKTEFDVQAYDQILLGIYNTILVKDVTKRNGISDITILEKITKFLAGNVGSFISTSNVTKEVVKGGRPILQKTVDKYIKALCDSFLFYKVDRYNVKGKTVLKTNSKYYVVDTGLRNVLLSSENLDVGHQIENIVFLELLRRGYRVNIGKVDDLEIDFVATKLNTKEYYQVSTTVLDNDVLKRELTPLRKTKDEYQKFLITLDDFEGNHEGVKQINLKNWLLGNN